MHKVSLSDLHLLRTKLATHHDQNFSNCRNGISLIDTADADLKQKLWQDGADVAVEINVVEKNKSGAGKIKSRNI